MEHDSDHKFYTVRGYQNIESGSKELSPAMEDYLEMIARLCISNGSTRIGIISSALNVKPSSASKMAAKLKEIGYLSFDLNNCIYLTSHGRQAADYLLYRHEIIERFLTVIGSDEPRKETELIEHYLSPKTVAALRDILLLLQNNI